MAKFDKPFWKMAVVKKTKGKIEYFQKNFWDFLLVKKESNWKTSLSSKEWKIFLGPVSMSLKPNKILSFKKIFQGEKL